MQEEKEKPEYVIIVVYEDIQNDIVEKEEAMNQKERILEERKNRNYQT